jgi:murein DD-endopeptidase MepM/ murein hydrolase activator NlpD
VQVDGETVADAADSDETAPAPGDTKSTRAHKAPRKPRPSRGTAFKRVTAASFSVGVMGIVGLMTVGMTTPAEAVAAASGVDASMMTVIAPDYTGVTDISADEIQAYVAPSTVEAATLNRSGSYDTTTVAEVASQAGISNFSNLFHNDPNAAIQWPFVVGVTMSYGFGMRDGKLHKGIDFTPGAGAPIQAIADGTVRVATEAGGDYGVHVIIDHVIDGQLISSHYAHMQYGSLQVVPGQKVNVGTVLGHTGNTGLSYGAHTHFELLVNGTTPIDPMPWLRQHAGG